MQFRRSYWLFSSFHLPTLPTPRPRVLERALRRKQLTSLLLAYSLKFREENKLPKRLTFFFRCYLVDNLANLVTDPDFLLVSTTDAREYERVSLGRKEGDIMKLLVTKHKFFVPNQRVDFQGICSVSPYAPKVS